MINVIKNIVICVDHLIIGLTIIIAISTSKITNSTISRKNRIEKDFRGIESKFIPHSNDEFLLDHFFIHMLKSTGVMIIAIVIIVRMSK